MASFQSRNCELICTLSEATIAKRPYGFCQENEKAMMGAKLIPEGKIVPVTMPEMLNEFPTGLADRIDNHLINLSRNIKKVINVVVTGFGSSIGRTNLELS